MQENISKTVTLERTTVPALRVCYKMRQCRLPNEWTCLQVLSAVMVLSSVFLVAFTRFATIACFSDLRSLPFNAREQRTEPQGSDLLVDLGYKIYAGVVNSSTGLNVFKG
jgi:hypothetical protein